MAFAHCLTRNCYSTVCCCVYSAWFSSPRYNANFTLPVNISEVVLRARVDVYYVANAAQIDTTCFSSQLHIASTTKNCQCSCTIVLAISFNTCVSADLPVATHDFTADHVAAAGSRHFCVRSHDSGNIYSVDFGQNWHMPSCGCEDWHRYHWPCKHFCAVFQVTSYTWEDLSACNRDSPYFTTDEDILKVLPVSQTLHQLQHRRLIFTHQVACVRCRELLAKTGAKATSTWSSKYVSSATKSSTMSKCRHKKPYINLSLIHIWRCRRRG